MRTACNWKGGCIFRMEQLMSYLQVVVGSAWATPQQLRRSHPRCGVHRQECVQCWKRLLSTAGPIWRRVPHQGRSLPRAAAGQIWRRAPRASGSSGTPSRRSPQNSSGRCRGHWRAGTERHNSHWRSFWSAGLGDRTIGGLCGGNTHNSGRRETFR